MKKNSELKIQYLS